jgi:LDH2 family malate/lactate/ureidoglycolate dehydrogenase
MDDLIRRLKDSPKAEGQTRIYIHGEKEFEAKEERLRTGIPLGPKVAETLQAIARELGVPLEFQV